MLADVSLGTNPSLLHLLFALLSGRFLGSRGAVFAALDNLGLTPDAVRRADAALREGRWQSPDLLARLRHSVPHEGRFVPRPYEGVRPVACDTTGYPRPQLPLACLCQT